MAYWMSKDETQVYVVTGSGYEHYVASFDVFGTRYYRYVGTNLHLPKPEALRLFPVELKPYAPLAKAVA